MNDLKDVTLTFEEQRVLRLALSTFIIEESRASRVLDKMQCHHIKKALDADIVTASAVLKLI